MASVQHAKCITVEDIRSHRKSVLKSKETSVKFLKDAGIITSKGNIANAYSEKHKADSYRCGK